MYEFTSPAVMDIWFYPISDASLPFKTACAREQTINTDVIRALTRPQNIKRIFNRQDNPSDANEASGI
jgi:hypothetical protein